MEHGHPHFDPRKKIWGVYWSEIDGKQHSTSYPRWWWLMNKGKIPDGHMISYIDGNKENIDPSNFECIVSRKALGKGGHKTLGKERPSIQGEKSRWWTGGLGKEYPLRFSRTLKKRVKKRDDYTCQACRKKLNSKELDVHHKDANRNHNTDDNMVTLCKPCHRGVHGKQNIENKKILYFRSLLPRTGI